MPCSEWHSEWQWGLSQLSDIAAECEVQDRLGAVERKAQAQRDSSSPRLSDQTTTVIFAMVLPPNLRGVFLAVSPHRHNRYRVGLMLPETFLFLAKVAACIPR